jgi:hypothetical protein
MDQYPSSLQPWGASMNPPEPLDHHTTRPSNSTQSSIQSSTPGGQHPHQPPHNPTILQVCAEVKPRLTKEQHDILERHFQQQPKPSTHTKKGFADMLGVPLDKINVCSYYGKSSALRVLTVVLELVPKSPSQSQARP